MKEASGSRYCSFTRPACSYLIPNSMARSDVTFHLTDGSTMAGHRAILAARCPYFKCVFGPGHGDVPLFREASQLSLKVEHVAPTTFRTLLSAIYTDGADINEENVLDVLEASSFYMLGGLQRQCEDFLCAKLACSDCSTRDNQWALEHVAIVWNLGFDVGSQAILDACQHLLAARFEPISRSASFADLPADALLTLLSREKDGRRELTVSCERRVLDAVIDWCWARVQAIDLDKNAKQCPTGVIMTQYEPKTPQREELSPPSSPLLTASWWTINPQNCQVIDWEGIVDSVAVTGDALWPHIRWNMLPKGDHPFEESHLCHLAHALMLRYEPIYCSSSPDTPRVSVHTRELLLDGMLGGRSARMIQSPNELSSGISLFEKGVPRSGPDDLTWLLPACNVLKKIDLTGCVAATPKSLHSLSQCSHLEWLSLAGCVQLECNSVINVLQSFPRLKTLILDDLPLLTDSIFHIGFEGLLGLREVSVKRCGGLTDNAFSKLGQQSWGWTWCDAIERIDLKGCVKISHVGIGLVAAVCTNLSVLVVQGTHADNEELRKLECRPGYHHLQFL